MDKDSPTVQIAQSAVSATFETIPAPVIAKMKAHFLDTLGCAIFASSLPHCRKLVGVAETMGGVPEATIMGHAYQSSALHAALVNGTSASGFEVDDVGAYSHPGASVIPAACAAAQRQGSVDGRRFLTALVWGYETCIRVAEAVGPTAELVIGWHTPPFHGTLGAAIAAGMIFGENDEQMLNTLSLAADVGGGGLMSARLGADVKRLHCGRSAEGGLLSALLGREGFTGTHDVLERDPWGYCSTMSYTGAGVKNYDLNQLTDNLGTEFIALDRVSIKFYPVSGDELSIIDNLQSLRRENGFSGSDVDKVKIGFSNFAHMNRPHKAAHNATTASFSARYAAAMALLHDLPPLYESDQVIKLWPVMYNDPEVTAMQSLIEEEIDRVIDGENPYSIDTSTVVQLKNGTQFSRRTDWGKGAPSDGTIRFPPLTNEQVESKFRNLASQVLPAGQIDDLIAGVRELESAADVGQLVALAGLVADPA